MSLESKNFLTACSIQSMAVLSVLPVRIRFPSGEKHTEFTALGMSFKGENLFFRLQHPRSSP